jgi:hypothetical protein
MAQARGHVSILAVHAYLKIYADLLSITEPPPGYGKEEYCDDEELELYDDPYPLEKKDRAQE